MKIETRTPCLTASSTQALAIASAVATLISFSSISTFWASPRMRNLSLSAAKLVPTKAVTAAAAGNPTVIFMICPPHAMPAAASAPDLPDLAGLIKLGARAARHELSALGPRFRGDERMCNTQVMELATDTSASGLAIAFAGEVARLWERELAQEFLGFYLIGSLAHGGFG